MNRAQIWTLVAFTPVIILWAVMSIHVIRVTMRDIKKQRERKRNFRKEINNTFN
jgi:hypothetical protein